MSNYIYHLIRAGVGQTAVCCCPLSSLAKRSLDLPRDPWEKLLFKQRKRATFLRTGLLIHGVSNHINLYLLLRKFCRFLSSGFFAAPLFILACFLEVTFFVDTDADIADGFNWFGLFVTIGLNGLLLIIQFAKVYRTAVVNDIGFLDVLFYDLLMSTIPVPRFVDRIRGLNGGVQNET